MTTASEITVSVVMGVYNGANFLNESINSVLSQQGVAFELIIVNDGSIDSTDAILADFAARDSRVRVLTQANQGLTCALISGCSIARGKYIARLDCGDIALPGRLNRQADILDNHPDCVFVSCWTEFFGPNGEYLYTAKGTGAAGNRPNIILSPSASWGTIDGPSSHISVMFRADEYRNVGGYRDAFYFAQDWDLWYRLAERGTFLIINQRLCRARVTANSISFVSHGVQRQFALQSLRALRLRQDGLSDEIALESARQIVRPTLTERQKKCRRAGANYYIARILTKNRDQRAHIYLLRALRLRPLYLRSWFALFALSALLFQKKTFADSASCD